MKPLKDFQGIWNISYTKDAKQKPSDDFIKKLKHLEGDYVTSFLKDFQGK